MILVMVCWFFYFWRNFDIATSPSQIYGFRAFHGKCMERIAWNLACCCVLPTSENDSILVAVWWFFYLLAQFWLGATFAVSGHVMDNASKEWSDNLVWWCLLTTSRNYSILFMVCWFFYFWAQIWLSEICCFLAFYGERTEGMTWNMVCWCILTTSRNDLILVTVCWFSSRWGLCHYWSDAL